MSNHPYLDVDSLGTGRLFKPDPGDLNFLMSSVVPTEEEVPEPRTFKYWPSYTHHLYQNGFPHCVGYGSTHLLLDSPITKPIVLPDGVIPTQSMNVTGNEAYNHLFADTLYHYAQLIDGFPLPHDGTTVRAAAKVLQRWGFIGNYYWAQSANDIKLAVLYKSPVVVGTLWFPGMARPDSNNVMRLTGNPGGMGHCYMIDGYNDKTGYGRVKNSHSRRWGYNGYARIAFEDVDTLLFNDGEGMIATEVKR